MSIENWHGTTSGYTNRLCRCDSCRAAWATYNREVTARRKAATKDPDDPRHGTPSFYGNHGCRCERCRAGWAAAMNEDRRNRQAAKRRTKVAA